MTALTLQEAQDKLGELVHQLHPGDEVVITVNEQPVARIVPVAEAESPRQLGTMRGTVLHMAPDFDAPLADFEEAVQ